MNGAGPSNFSSGLARAHVSVRRHGRPMNCKTDQIRAAWHAGDRIGALRMAARFFDRSVDTLTFKRGMNAHNHPGFYRQLGKDPEQLTQAALELLARKLKL
jgi:hypothetical protein